LNPTRATEEINDTNNISNMRGGLPGLIHKERRQTMKLAMTGHRPKSLGMGYEIPNPIYDKIYNAILEKFQELSPEKIISGMALGVDTAACWAAIELNIPFVAAVPCDGQDSMWPEDTKRIYRHLLSLAEKVVIVSPGSYAPDKMHTRDRWMIDNSDCLLAVWNGVEKGGTYGTVRYAQKQQLVRPEYKIHRINPTCL